MAYSNCVSPNFIRITTATGLANHPPTSQDIQAMKSGCEYVQMTETKIRLVAIVAVVIFPLLTISFSANWGDLGIAMLLSGVCYFALVSLTPKIIRSFYEVSFKVDGQELIDAMNKKLFLHTHCDYKKLAMSNLAKAYSDHLSQMNRAVTVFDIYVIHFLNEDGKQTGQSILSEVSV